MRPRTAFISLFGFSIVVVAMLLSTAPPTRVQPLPSVAMRPQAATRPARLLPVASHAPQLRAAFEGLPLSFEPNLGQADARSQFTAHGPGYSVSLSGDEAVVMFQRMDPAAQGRFAARKYYLASPRFWRARKTGAVGIKVAGAAPNPLITPLDELLGKSNYFIGKDPNKWRRGVPNYGRVKYSGIYPGIDLVFYGRQQQLEFDFVIAPGSDARTIALRIETEGRLKLTRSGDLELNDPVGSLELHRPEIYQLVEGQKVAVEGKFVLKQGNQVGIELGSYDHALPLTVDPVLSYSTYLGGNTEEWPEGIVVDAQGNAYIEGATISTNYPVQNGYPSQANPANVAAFVSKMNPTGTALLYSTYLGGSVADWAAAIALDPAGNVYVTGSTMSPDFPIVNGFQAALGTGNGNAFFVRIDTTQSGIGSLIYSTYIGGGGNQQNWLGDVGLGIAVDASGFAYVTGQTGSDNSTAAFPTTAGAFQTSLASVNGNGFLTVVDASSTGASSLVYSTYLGGGSTGAGDWGQGIAVDAFGDAFLSGYTTSGGSTPFPVTPSAFQSTLNSPYGNAFVSEIATTQSGAQALLYSTYLGGSSSIIVGDAANGLTLDATGAVYVAGDTTSADFPVTSGAFQTTNSAEGKGFAAKLDLTQSGSPSLVYSTLLGGTNGPNGDIANTVSVNSSGEAFIAGNASSSDFPTTADAFIATKRSSEWSGYLTVLNAAGTALVYSTFLSGSCSTGLGDAGFTATLDSLGNAYVAGRTCSTDFPVQPSNAYQTTLAGIYNSTITKFAFSATPGITASAVPSPNAAGWNNSSVTVSFTCIPAGAPLVSCSSPVVVSTEGANQTATGTVTDTANNSASASVTVNLDLTPPALSVSSPASNSTVNAPYVAISGTASDALSGLAGVSCNGITAAVTSGSFSCTVPLFSVSNSVVVSATDVAGNVTTATLSVTVSMSAPTALTVTPGPVNLLIGQQQSFTAVDQTGTRRPDATWMVSNSSVASFVSGSPNTLQGVAAGQVTLTATVGSASGQTTVTVPSGSSLSPGTVLWSANPVAGFTAQKIIQAVPAAGGPDLYSIETDSSNDVLVRAFQSDGEQLWQAPLSTSLPSQFYFSTAAGDNSGGLLLVDDSDGYLVDVNPQTGQPNWQFAAGGGGEAFYSDVAIGPTGVISVAATAASPSGTEVLGVDGSSGSVVYQVVLPAWSSTIAFCGESPFTSYGPPGLGAPMVGPDGNLYLEVEASQSSSTYTEVPVDNGVDYTCVLASVNATYPIQLLEITPSGAAQYLNVASYTYGPDPASVGSATPGEVIPDGNGGYLAGWQLIQPTGGVYNDYNYVADVGPGGVIAQQSIIPAPLGDSAMVLGDNNTAFVTDGTTVAALNLAGFQVPWNYSSSGGTLSIVNATPGGSITISDSQQGVIQLDSAGAPSAAVSALLGALPFDMESWQMISNGVPALAWSPDGTNSIPNAQAPSPSPAPQGNPQQMKSPPLCQLLNCVLAPYMDNIFDNGPPVGRQITYGLYAIPGTNVSVSGLPLYKNMLNRLANRKIPYEIVLQETLTAQNSYQNYSICEKTGSPCSNKNTEGQGSDYNNAILKDKLQLAPFASGTLSVLQQFLVDRQPVQVYWPRKVIDPASNSTLLSWFGAPVQTATVTQSSVKISQVPALGKGVSCANASPPPAYSCSTTAP